ncbi:MAG: Hsp20/alpha crystallin family protein [Verrucomicrobia bacterium]|nr:Hsp20/alpha crystallin family protein [Verrucomicrobiota bacterium]
MPKHHADEWDRIQQEVEKMLPDALGFSAGGRNASQGQWIPNADVYETPELLVVKMEVAGIRKEDLEVTLSERMLVVRGTRPDPCRHGKCSFRQMEIEYGPFERRIVIPRSVDPQRVTASYSNGFLRIELPKSEKAVHSTVTVIIEQS